MRVRNTLLLFVALCLPVVWGITATKPVEKGKTPAKAAPKAVAKAPGKKPAAKAYVSTRFTPTAAARKKRIYYNPYDTPTYADSTLGDNAVGEDPVVRQAATQALGPYNGSVVVADPTTGRILSIVNQKLALTGAFAPCSTIKLVSGLAGLSEGAIADKTYLQISRRMSMNLTTALAVSDNAFFQKIGYRIGFEKLKRYAREFGLGEKAGLDIDGESAGSFPEVQLIGVPVGFMCSHGLAIGMTPLQLTAIVSSIANGGTLYYLQYPRSPEETLNFAPKVKRQLDVQTYMPSLRPGMQGSAEWGTGRRAFYDPAEPIFGKTGTCSDGRTHLGWFGSYNEVNGRKLVVVVLLTGGHPVNGPVASGIAGQVYKNLSASQYFSQATGVTSPGANFAQ